MTIRFALEQLFVWSLAGAALASLALLSAGSLLRIAGHRRATLPLCGLLLFAAAFGTAGLLSPVADLPNGPRLGWAAGIAALCTACLSWLVARYFRDAGSAEVAAKPLYGTIAEVTVPLPEAGVGQIAFGVNGARVTMAARSASGRALTRAARVVIVDIAGHVACVEELGL